MNTITLSLLLFFTSPAISPAPATAVTVINECVGTSEKFIPEESVLSASVTSKNTKVYKLRAAEGDAYPISLCTDTQCYRYGNMTFLKGHQYSVTISGCNLPGVRIESHEINVGTAMAMSKIRFRSRRVRAVEYRHAQSRFRRLSVGMSKYQDVKLSEAGSLQIQFRYRIKPGGPVEYLSTHQVRKVIPGHRYFIEVEYFGLHRELIKIQDEGAMVGEKN